MENNKTDAQREVQRLMEGLGVLSVNVRMYALYLIASRVMMHDVIEFIKNSKSEWMGDISVWMSEIDGTEALCAVQVASFYLKSTDAFDGSIVEVLTDEKAQANIIKIMSSKDGK